MPDQQRSPSSLLGKYERFGIELGLDRILAILDYLGNPQTSVPIVHVTGTNGKGSVCAYLSSVLESAGYRVGRYTSPHLLDWTERICIDNHPISADCLVEALLAVEAAGKRSPVTLTQFEVITAAAWHIFASKSVDIAVIEVGLGGRLDATNVCDRPLVSIITSISLEHWQRLGPTLADIAREKAGIIKPKCPVIMGPLPSEARAVVLKRAQNLESPVIQPKAAQWLEGLDPSATDSTWAIADHIRYPLPLKGEIQLQNSALAIAAIQSLRAQGWDISSGAIATGMSQTQWPGRLEWTQWKNQPLLIDGAHNPAAAKVLRHYVDSLNTPAVHWIIGMLATKDHQDIFEILLRPDDCLSLVPVPGHMSADLSTLKQLAQVSCPNLQNCQVFDTLQMALEVNLSSIQGLKVLCGSLYLLGDFLRSQQKNA